MQSVMTRTKRTCFTQLSKQEITSTAHQLRSVHQDQGKCFVLANLNSKCDQFESETFVHVFQSCSQDSTVVVSIMQDVLVALKKEIPELQRAYYKQDNAGCYHSGYTIVSAKLAGDVAGVTVVRNDFSDPQGGKGMCNRQAATIKGNVAPVG